MKAHRSDKSYLVYGISLAATFTTLLILHYAFESPLLVSVFLITGAHALGYAALRVIPYYSLWMPPLTALYLSSWFWLCTPVAPRFMAQSDKTPDFGTTESWVGLWIATLSFCCIAGIIFLIKKIIEDPEKAPVSKENSAKKNIHPFTRVAVYSLSVLLMTALALGAYIYRENKLAAIKADLTSPEDYDAVLLNLFGTANDDIPSFRDKDSGKNRVTIYEAIEDISHKELIFATQKTWVGKGDNTIGEVILRHKNATVNPLRDYTPKDVTLIFTNTRDDIPQEIALPSPYREQLIAMMRGEVTPLYEHPKDLGRGSYSYEHNAHVTITFEEYESVYWRGIIEFTLSEEWYLTLYKLPEDFDVTGEWDPYTFERMYYPLNETWKTLVQE